MNTTSFSGLSVEEFKPYLKAVPVEYQGHATYACAVIKGGVFHFVGFWARRTTILFQPNVMVLVDMDVLDVQGPRPVTYVNLNPAHEEDSDRIKSFPL